MFWPEKNPTPKARPWRNEHKAYLLWTINDYERSLDASRVRCNQAAATQGCTVVGIAKREASHAKTSGREVRMEIPHYASALREDRRRDNQTGQEETEDHGSRSRI